MLQFFERKEIEWVYKGYGENRSYTWSDSVRSRLFLADNDFPIRKRATGG